MSDVLEVQQLNNLIRCLRELGVSLGGKGMSKKEYYALMKIVHPDSTFNMKKEWQEIATKLCKMLTNFYTLVTPSPTDLYVVFEQYYEDVGNLETEYLLVKDELKKLVMEISFRLFPTPTRDTTEGVSTRDTTEGVSTRNTTEGVSTRNTTEGVPTEEVPRVPTSLCECGNQKQTTHKFCHLCFMCRCNNSLCSCGRTLWVDKETGDPKSPLCTSCFKGNKPCKYGSRCRYRQTCHFKHDM
jgi:hypothetical protein